MSILILGFNPVFYSMCLFISAGPMVRPTSRSFYICAYLPYMRSFDICIYERFYIPAAGGTICICGRYAIQKLCI